MSEDRALTKAGNLKQPQRQDVINWISVAWKSIKETFVHSFLVCRLSNALDGSEDDLVSDDVPAIDAGEIEPTEEEDRRRKTSKEVKMWMSWILFMRTRTNLS